MTTVREDFFSNERTLTVKVSDNSNNWTYFTSNKFIFDGFQQETSNYSYNQCVKNKFFKPSKCVEEVKVIDFDYYDVTVGSWKDNFFDGNSVNKTYILNTVYPKVVASISFSNIFENKKDYKTMGELRIKAPSGEIISVGTRRELTLKLNGTGIYLFSFYPSKSVPKTFRNPTYFRILVDGYPPSVDLAVNEDSDSKIIKDVTLSIKDNVKLDFTHCYYAWHSNSLTPDYLNSCDLTAISESEGEVTLIAPDNIKDNPYLHVVFSDVIGTKTYRFNLTSYIETITSTTNTSISFKNEALAILETANISKNDVLEENKLSNQDLIIGIIFVVLLSTYLPCYLFKKKRR